MPRKTTKIPSALEIQEAVANALRRTSVRPSIAGYRPMEHQEKFHTMTQPGRLFVGGNRSGKTVAGGAESVYWLRGDHPNRPVPPAPVRGRGVASDFDHGVALIMLPEIARWCPPSLLLDGSWDRSYNKGSRILTLSNGSTMEFLSTDQDLDKHAGTSRHFCWFDEEPPEAYFNENLMRLVDTGGSYWLTMTPLFGMTFIYDRIYIPAQQDNPEVGVVEASIDMNHHINASEIQVYMSGLSADEKKARREGKFVQLGGIVYGKSFSEENVIDDVYTSGMWEELKSNKWAFFNGMDHGFNNPTCWLWGAVNANGTIIIYDEYYVSREVVKTHAQEVNRRNRLLEIAPSYNVGDPSIRNTDPITGTSVLLEYMENDVPIILGNNDVRAGINRVAAYFEGKKLFISRRCEKLLWELARYRWAKWASAKTDSNRNVQEVPAKKDDHACDTLRYMVASRPDMEVPVNEEISALLKAKELGVQVKEAVDNTKPLIDWALATAAPRTRDDLYDDYLGSDW